MDFKVMLFIYLVDHMKIQKLHENTKIYLEIFTLHSQVICFKYTYVLYNTFLLKLRYAEFHVMPNNKKL